MCHVVNYPIRSLDEMTTYAHPRESPYRQNTDIVGRWISFPSHGDLFAWIMSSTWPGKPSSALASLSLPVSGGCEVVGYLGCGCGYGPLSAAFGGGFL